MTRLRSFVALLVMIVMVPVVAAAAEAAPEAPSVWYGNVQLWEIVASVLATVWLTVKAKYKLTERMDDRILTFIEQGCQVAFDEFVRDTKLKSPKGKLTAAQVKESRERAWNAAKEFAKQQGVDLVKKVAAEKVPLLINKVVGKMKH